MDCLIDLLNTVDTLLRDSETASGTGGPSERSTMGPNGPGERNGLRSRSLPAFDLRTQVHVDSSDMNFGKPTVVLLTQSGILPEAPNNLDFTRQKRFIALNEAPNTTEPKPGS